jgi:vacuolar-type H+-ATPase subunit D/Vma8
MTRQELIVYKEQLTKAITSRHLFPAERENLKWELKRVIAELDELDKKRGA